MQRAFDDKRPLGGATGPAFRLLRLRLHAWVAIWKLPSMDLLRVLGFVIEDVSGIDYNQTWANYQSPKFANSFEP
jgi:hypothetical protein